MTSDHQTPDNVFYQSINQFQHPIRGLPCNLSEIRNHGDTHTSVLSMKGLLTITLLDIIDIWLGKSSCIYNIYSKDASEVRTQVPKTMTNEE